MEKLFDWKMSYARISMNSSEEIEEIRNAVATISKCVNKIIVTNEEEIRCIVQDVDKVMAPIYRELEQNFYDTFYL
jgi:hypothetical protein